MIREKRIAGVRIHAVGLAVCLALVFGSVNAYAGDGDGIFGYSMKLKNKDFTTDDGNGSNLVVGAAQKKTPGVPQLANSVAQPRENVSLWVFGQVRVWIGVWTR